MPALAAEGMIVRFRSIDEVQEFSKAVNEFRGDVDLRQGRMTVDAKSLLGICSMDIDKGMQVHVYTGDVQALREKIRRFLG